MLEIRSHINIKCRFLGGVVFAGVMVCFQDSMSHEEVGDISDLLVVKRYFLHAKIWRVVSKLDLPLEFFSVV